MDELRSTMEGLPYLEDGRVALATLAEEHVPKLVRWINDQSVLHYIDLHGGFNQEQEREWLRRITASSTDHVFGILRLEDGALVGDVGLHGVSQINACAEYGIMLGERDCWGQGLGTAAGRLILDYGFNRLNLHRIFLRVMAYNERGIRSYAKLGFQPEGRLRQHVWRDGAYHDLLFMGVLRDEFNAQWAAWREAQRERYQLGS